MAESQTYFVRRRGRIEGPWTIEKLKSEVALRKLGRHHELSIDKNDWFRASQLESLFQRLQPTAPIAAKRADPVEDEIELELEPEDIQERGPEIRDRGPDAWYYYIAGEQHGPVSSQQIMDLAQARRLGPEDLVWREGMDEWVRLSHVPDFLDANDEETDEIELWDDELSPARDRLATVALVLAICLLVASPVPFVGILGVIPLTMGILSLSRIRRSQGILTGGGSATAAIILSVFALVISTFIGVWTLLFTYPFPLP